MPHSCVSEIPTYNELATLFLCDLGIHAHREDSKCHQSHRHPGQDDGNIVKRVTLNHLCQQTDILSATPITSKPFLCDEHPRGRRPLNDKNKANPGSLRKSLDSVHQSVIPCILEKFSQTSLSVAYRWHLSFKRRTKPTSMGTLTRFSIRLNMKTALRSVGGITGSNNEFCYEPSSGTPSDDWFHRYQDLFMVDFSTQDSRQDAEIPNQLLSRIKQDPSMMLQAINSQCHRQLNLNNDIAMVQLGRHGGS
ncbi:hypothetical protein CLF_100302 [Clonorchis sinensis]|uniref:Uncharacterized protein n=1 Tax=Clonorchis sinensis TaxID=79923 RepID=H2KNJ8_CLOSI|nr:hypothetical protein CLF_100302 [Clonorchis sinensis]